MAQRNTSAKAEANQAAHRSNVGRLSRLAQSSHWGHAAFLGEQSQVKELIARMATEEKKGKPRFSAKSISNYVQVVKMVVASAVNDKGEEIYPVKWNHDFMDLPEVKDQRTPTFTAEEISSIISEAQGQYSILYALLAGSGLRAEEAFALQVEDIRGSVISVRHSLWRGKLYPPKTPAAIREVDLHPSLAEAIHDHVNGRTSGFVFRTVASNMDTPNHEKSHQISAESSTFVARGEPRRFHFTNKRLAALLAPTNGQRSYFYDDEVRGLAIAVSPVGKKTFVLYRKVAGRPERISIGPYGDLSVDQAAKRGDQDERRHRSRGEPGSKAPGSAR
jgi:integrase